MTKSKEPGLALYSFLMRILQGDFDIFPEEFQYEKTFGDCGLDSLDFMEIIIALEREFSIHFRDETLKWKETTFRELFDYAEELINAKQTIPVQPVQGVRDC